MGHLRSTRTRLTLVYSLLFTVVITLAALGFWLASSAYEYAAVDASLREQALIVRTSVEASTPASPLHMPVQGPRGLPIETFLIVDGNVVGETPLGVESSIGSSLIPADGFPSSPVITTRILRGQALRVLIRATSYYQRPAGLIVLRAIDDLRASLVHTAVYLLVGCLGLVVAAGALAHWLSGRALLPVREMAEMVRTISDQDLRQRVHTDLPADDELGHLAATFNGMLERLEHSFASLRQFTADAAHELRTPLAMMRTRVEVTLRSDRSEAVYREALNDLLGEIDRLSGITDRLLMLARADAGTLAPNEESFDLPDLLEEVVDHWRSAGPGGVVLDAKIPLDGRIRADRALLRLVFDNLLDNAYKHSPRGGRVTLRVGRQNGSWVVDVTDQGSGIPADLRPLLFHRFARGDASRSGGGAGLGLAICAAIVELHGGSIELVDRRRAGAAFRVSLPA